MIFPSVLLDLIWTNVLFFPTPVAAQETLTCFLLLQWRELILKNTWQLAMVVNDLLVSSAHKYYQILMCASDRALWRRILNTRATAVSYEWFSVCFCIFLYLVLSLPMFWHGCVEAAHWLPLVIIPLCSWPVIQFLQPVFMAVANSSSATSGVSWLHRSRFPQLLTSRGVSGYLTLTELSSRLFCCWIS